MNEDRVQPSHWLERLPIAQGRPLAGFAATCGLIAGAYFLRVVAAPWLPPGFPYVTFFPAVVIASFLFGVRMGLFAGLLCGLLAWYFFIPPVQSLQLGSGAIVALAFYVLVIGTDLLIIHWLQRTNNRLADQREINRRLAETRALLFGELQHRVSNNLQVTAGLLSLSKRRVTEPEGKAALDEASRRLALIGRISRQLYDAGGATRSMREFLEPLCADVIDASGRTGVRCTVNVADDAPLSPDAAIPLALIVAEAMANAIEHGFADREHGLIEVELSRDGERVVRVDVRDDGHGLPQGFEIEASNSLGLRIATMLAEQLNGRFELLAGKGTTARLSLPV